jgi:hypothetical protein
MHLAMKGTLSYLQTHKARIQRRHYYIQAGTSTLWFNFYRNVLNEYIKHYGDGFCLIIDHDRDSDDAYILPYTEVKHFFTLAYLRKTRWVGNIIAEYFTTSRRDQPVQQMYVSEFHNAFELLRDAPQPIPLKPKVERYV